MDNDEKKNPPLPQTPAATPKQNQIADPLIQQFLQTQHQKALNEAEQIKLRGKELDNSKALSEKFMEIDSKLEADKPSETRKTITRIAYIAFGFTILTFGFVGYCLYIGKEQFLIELIKIVLYPVLTFAGYYLGKKTKNKKDKNSEKFDEHEVVDP
jgi:hypothetical protein